MQLDIIVLFFVLGFIARIIGSDLKIPKGFHHGISIFLMLAIGLKGGTALAENISTSLFLQASLFIVLGLLLPFIVFPIFKWVGNFKTTDAATIAAHYGSVSIGTYAVAVALLESQQIAYESYFPLFVVLLEFPAMFVAVFLANKGNGNVNFKHWVQHILKNESIVLLFGGLLIGLVAQEQMVKLTPLFKELFTGVLALFLLCMGMDAASKVNALKQDSAFLLAVGTVAPLINGFIGGIFATAMGLSTGGIFLTIVLGASASYIAVPIAMRSLIPEANHSYGMTTSLGITFPFNILAGMPVYWVLAIWFSNF
ncbi:sodium-dependent bicarbonate transport family permease [Aliikangiella sp. G2MR2-5]|uniref:sodium-dependent bicarbonate transport family permease n=1 Tax=Aliikangiella sp. G2MR2-5 TaxID=2788943 RepID=UPI0018AB1E67|nr:sodium-dependent bicarbonate transport family permease [Aliikangiella sp. G2MR2-5]